MKIKRALSLSLLFVLIVLVFILNAPSYKNACVSYVVGHVVKSRLNYEWVVNTNMLQYSSYLVLNNKGDGSADIEIFLFQIDVDYDELECVVRGRLRVPVQRLIKINPPLMKAYCKVNTDQLGSEVLVALVERKSKLADDQLLYQKAVFIDATRKKRSSVGHCVHAMYGIDSVDSSKAKSFDKWVQLQKSIGIGEIRVYVHSLPDAVLDHFRAKYSGFVEFVDNRYDEDTYCNFISAHAAYTALCKRGNELFNIGFRERIQTNDCYQNLRYKYEMVTNYDIDEMIFPRHHDCSEQLANYSFGSCDSLCGYLSSNRSYSLYDYAKRVFDRLNSKVTACVMFKHFPLIRTDEHLDKFFALTRNLTSPTMLLYTDETDKGIRIRVDNADNVARLQLYSKLYETLKKCSHEPSPTSEFNRRLFGFYSDGRFGKSIFNTDLVETVNQHSSDIMAPGTVKTELPLEHGFSAHFRNDYKGFFQDKNYFMQDLVLDVEYYLFVLKNLENKIC